MAPLGRDQDIRRIATVGTERLGDQCLVVAHFVGADVIGVRRVDQRDPGVGHGSGGTVDLPEFRRSLSGEALPDVGWFLDVLAEVPR
jgi:hypothetical protein